MTLPIKSTIKLGVLVAVAIGASLSSQALPVTGTISFYGDVVATTSTAPGSPVVANGDFTQAGGLRFDLNQFVAANPSGSFASVIPNTVASLYPVLKINGPAIPPGGAPLWTVTDAYGDAFVFTLTSLLEPLLTPHVMVLTGTGTIHEQYVAPGNPTPMYSDNEGSWTATFNSVAAGPFVTFAWNSVGAFSPVPETGSTALLLGLGMLSVGSYARFRKNEVAARLIHSIFN